MRRGVLRGEVQAAHHGHRPRVVHGRVVLGDLREVGRLRRCVAVLGLCRMGIKPEGMLRTKIMCVLKCLGPITELGSA